MRVCENRTSAKEIGCPRPRIPSSPTRKVSVIVFTSRTFSEGEIGIGYGGGTLRGFLHKLEPFLIFSKCTMLKKKRKEVIFTRFRRKGHHWASLMRLPERFEAVSPVFEPTAVNPYGIPIFNGRQSKNYIPTTIHTSLPPSSEAFEQTLT